MVTPNTSCRARARARVLRVFFINDFEALRIDTETLAPALLDDCAVRERGDKGNITGAVCTLRFVSGGLSDHAALHLITTCPTAAMKGVLPRGFVLISLPGLFAVIIRC